MEFLYFLVPVSLVAGWYIGRYYRKNISSGILPLVPGDYFRGLNYIINEEQDKAIALFVRLLENNPDLVETHIALGALFRRRGETERAIAIHESLLNQKNLNREQRIESMLELGRDYMNAGLLDRAEVPFNELKSINNYRYVALKNLNEIYDKEKDWDQAMDVALELAKIRPKEKWNHVIANYNCEKALLVKDEDEAEKHIRAALKIDPDCARASILWAEIYKSHGNYDRALLKYQDVEKQRPELMSIVLPGMLEVYEKIADIGRIIEHLEELMSKYPSASVMIALVEKIKLRDGSRDAENYLIEALKTRPTVFGLEYLVNLYFDRLKSGRDKARIAALRELLQKLLEEKSTYKCSNCGFQARKIHWQCPGCRSWGTISPTTGVLGQ